MSMLDIFNGFRRGSSIDPARTPIDDGSAATNTTVPNSNTPQNDGKVAALPDTTKNSAETSPLSGYQDLWAPNTVKGPDGKDIITTTAPPTLTPNMNIEPSKIMEAARTLDFTKSIAPELMDKASKGDAAAFAQVMNTMAQAAYGQGVLATSGIVQQAMTIQEKNLNERVMPDILRRHTIRTTVEGNPLSSNPAVAPLLGTIEQQLTSKYPTASPSEIKKHAETYLSGLAEEIVKGNGGTVVTKQSMDNAFSGSISRGADPDWEKYFGVTIAS